MSIDIPDNLAELAADPVYRPIPWPKLVAEVLDQYKPPLRSIATYRGMKHALEQVSGLTAVDAAGQLVPLVKMSSDLTPAVIGQLLKTRDPKLSPFSIRALLRYIRAAANIAVDHGRLRVSPFRRLPIGRLVRCGRPAGRRHLSAKELRALLDALAADVAEAKGWRGFKARRLQALVNLVAFTGLRRGEALGLLVTDLDLPGRMVHVRPRSDHRLKTDRSAAMVPLPDAVVPVLESWMPWRLAAPPGFKMPAEVPWLFPNCRRRNYWRDGVTGDKPLTMLKAAGVRAGIGGDINFQMLRRSYATHLRTRFGASRDLTSQILRHSPGVDDEFYVQDDADNLRSAVAGVNF